MLETHWRRIAADLLIWASVMEEAGKITGKWQRRNPSEKLGLPGIQKCTASMRMLAYGVAPDAVDEYLLMGQTTTRKCSCNDLNVLYYSLVFTDVLQGRAPLVKFNVNGHEYNMAYYLADGIYPSRATFVQGFTNPQTHKHMLFAEQQADARKDVECAFGVLQAKFAIVRQPALAYDEDVLADIMKACIIIHNMIVEDERDTYKNAEVTRRYYETDRPMSHLGGEASTSGTPNNDETFQIQTGHPIDINKYSEKRDAMRT
ncbi:uncharacterized protein LOC110724096 [Chenopodium quinoa]|uniref:uncharacterized protein LOC110724096 n=1 Tax=Chenopodium quinoa TaxID=63459 RepID=UPI000B77B164|nr:uncharacterized protein LOC110724096 [Chenopodium quinoa]